MERSDLNQSLPKVVEALVASVKSEPRLQHLNRVHLPGREAVVDIVKRLREVIYPGYFGRQGLTEENLQYELGNRIVELNDLLFDRVRCCLLYREQIPMSDSEDKADACDRDAAMVVSEFWKRI